MTTDTDFDRLSEGKRRQLFRFDPTVNTGTLMQMVLLTFGIFGAYSALKEGQATQRIELDQVKTEAANESQRVKETLTEIKGDLKELQRTVNEVNQSLATLKPRDAR